MAYAHRHTLVKHVKREHQGSPSSSGRKSNLKSTKSKDDSAKPAASTTTSGGHDNGAPVAPAEAADSSATGARETEGNISADPPTESVGQPPPEKSVA